MTILFYAICSALFLTISLTYLCGTLYFNQNHQPNKKRDISVYASMASALVPLLLLISFVYVYLQGGSSHAQASWQRSDLWSFWFNVYFPLFGFSVVAAPVSLIAFFMELNPKRNLYSFFCRLSSSLSFFPAFHVLFNTMPDA